jgi:hypothetical protein
MGFISKSTFRVVLTVPATLHAPVVNTPTPYADPVLYHALRPTLQSYMYANIIYSYLHPAEANGNNESYHKRKRSRPRTHRVKRKMIRSPYLVHATGLRRQPMIFSEGHADKCISAKRRAPEGREEVSDADMRGGLRPGLEIRCH